MSASHDPDLRRDAAATVQPPAAMLSDLAASFDPRDFITVLTTGQHRDPRLTVIARLGAATEDIYARDGCYWRACPEPIAPAGDPHTAAAMIARRLGQPHGIQR